MRKRALSWLLTRAVSSSHQNTTTPSHILTAQQLQHYPQSSVGYAVWTHLQDNGFTLIPGHERHDILHVLLDYDTDLQGELCIQAFLAGNRNLSLAGTLILTLATLVPEYLPALYRAFQRGCLSPSLTREQTVFYLDQNLHQAQASIPLKTSTHLSFPTPTTTH